MLRPSPPSSSQFAGSCVQFSAKSAWGATAKSRASPDEAEHGEEVTDIVSICTVQLLASCKKYISTGVYLRLTVSSHSTQRIVILHSCLFKCSACSTMFGAGMDKNCPPEAQVFEHVAPGWSMLFGAFQVVQPYWRKCVTGGEL
ncbi:mCG1027684 [Mus musculus]|jgi:hypothetical protein|nr:mCG1027684 [Mus musculus]